MCGINGLFGLERIQDPSQLIASMNDRLAHRGPDASGVQLFDNVCLGHRRLSIIDLSSTADQPMNSADGRLCMVFNGEIYNYREVRAKLTAYEFRTNSDSEVVLAAYQTWGKACLQEFNGMFALAIWDTEYKELFLARDRMGIKPLYYSFAQGSFVFSSEIRALLASGLVPRYLNKEVLPEYLSYQTVHDPATLVKDVYMLPAAHYMTITDAESSMHKYWDAIESGSERPSSPENTRTRIRELLTESVQRRMIADVPFGAFLSGGIDSSIMVGLMAQSASTQVSTFSVVFDDPAFSEAPYARAIADRFSTAHEEIRLRPDDFLELLPDALSAMDHPSGDGPNTYVVSKVTKAAGITVAISGLGGDELFAGYPHFMHAHSAMSKPWLSQYPMALRRLIASVLRAVKGGAPGAKAAEMLTAQKMDILHIYPVLRQALMQQERSLLLGRDEVIKHMGTALSDLTAHWRSLPILSQVSLAELNTYLRAVLLRDSDQMSMAHALEVRVPFLDHTLVEYVVKVEDSIKFPHSPKALLIDSVPDLLPTEIVNRPKMGFTLPWSKWMKNQLQDLCQESMSSLAGRGVMHEAGVNDLWRRFMADDQRITWARIWPLIVLENWMTKNEIEA